MVTFRDMVKFMRAVDEHGTIGIPKWHWEIGEIITEAYPQKYGFTPKPDLSGQRYLYLHSKNKD